MAKKIAAPVEKAPVRARTVVDDLADLKADVRELQGDLVRIADLCGKVWGEPLASEVMLIAKRRQG